MGKLCGDCWIETGEPECQDDDWIKCGSCGEWLHNCICEEEEEES